VNPDHFTAQVVIVHLSDIHFGPQHRFDPAPAPSGGIPASTGYPTLIEKLREDLDELDPGCPVIIAITGDLCTTASKEELSDARAFVEQLAAMPIFGKHRGISSIFIVPGNHDVSYADASIGNRLSGYAQLLSALHRSYFDAANPWEWPLVHDRVDDLGTIIACLNSSMYVEKGKPDQDRGHIDVLQLYKLETALKEIPADRLTRAAKIALVHHHPVLIPALAEPNRGYDAVLNSGKLLTMLRKFGFHVILHGHKHDPYIFTEDSKSAFGVSQQNPIVVFAGGSVASRELPTTRLNCYNRISIKWHPSAGQARVFSETRALSIFDEDGLEAIPANWVWKVAAKDDRHFLRGNCIPKQSTRAETIHVDKEFAPWQARTKEYERLRGNMLCAEVRPSLVPGQGYEAVVWLVPHGAPVGAPKMVTWTAGKQFREVIIVSQDADTRFCAAFNYWGPMLVQAVIEFHDGAVESGFIYARIPEDCSEES
jgi:3',5'-cyclic AMP phosphodiesterase CpdA